MNAFQKLAVALAAVATVSAPAVARDFGGNFYGGTVQSVTPTAIVLQTPANQSVTLAYTPFTKVKIREYSFYGKRKYRANVGALKAGDMVRKVKAAPAVDGSLMAYKLEVVR